MSKIGKLIQFVFILDTTGSMGWLREVMKQALLARIQKLLHDFPNVEIALVFIGDDNCHNERYSVEFLNFSRDIHKMVQWMDRVGNSYGGGPHANYELGLRAARQLTWHPDSLKHVEVVGDEVPNDKNFLHHDKTYCDWRFEAEQLVNMGATIDAVHCFPGMQRRTRPFYQELASIGEGHYLPQDQFDDLEVIALARIYTALSEDVSADNSPIHQYQAEVSGQGRMTKAVDQTFATLTHRQAKKFDLKTDLVPVPSGQLQLLRVNEDTKVKEFLTKNSFVTLGGEAVKRFYLYDGTRDGKRRTENVQWYKDVVLYHVSTGLFYSGDGVRKWLGLPLVAQRQDFVLTPEHLLGGDWLVYPESYSPGRALRAGTQLLVDQTQGRSTEKNPCR